MQNDHITDSCTHQLDVRLYFVIVHLDEEEGEDFFFLEINIVIYLVVLRDYYIHSVLHEI